QQQQQGSDGRADQHQQRGGSSGCDRGQDAAAAVGDALRLQRQQQSLTGPLPSPGEAGVVGALNTRDGSSGGGGIIAGNNNGPDGYVTGVSSTSEMELDQRPDDGTVVDHRRGGTPAVGTGMAAASRVSAGGASGFETGSPLHTAEARTEAATVGGRTIGQATSIAVDAAASARAATSDAAVASAGRRPISHAVGGGGGGDVGGLPPHGQANTYSGDRSNSSSSGRAVSTTAISNSGGGGGGAGTTGGTQAVAGVFAPVAPVYDGFGGGGSGYEAGQAAPGPRFHGRGNTDNSSLPAPWAGTTGSGRDAPQHPANPGQHLAGGGGSGSDGGVVNPSGSDDIAGGTHEA
ncbi:unnamed protein product, partial [Scytosiphon promiscuus]